MLEQIAGLQVVRKTAKDAFVMSTLIIVVARIGAVSKEYFSLLDSVAVYRNPSTFEKFDDRIVVLKMGRFHCDLPQPNITPGRIGGNRPAPFA